MACQLASSERRPMLEAILTTEMGTGLTYHVWMLAFWLHYNRWARHRSIAPVGVRWGSYFPMKASICPTACKASSTIHAYTGAPQRDIASPDQLYHYEICGRRYYSVCTDECMPVRRSQQLINFQRKLPSSLSGNWWVRIRSMVGETLAFCGVGKGLQKHAFSCVPKLWRNY
jgi:hypothetical protein